MRNGDAGAVLTTSYPTGGTIITLAATEQALNGVPPRAGRGIGKLVLSIPC